MNTQEKIVRWILNNFFKVRYFLIVCFLVGISYMAYRMRSHNISSKDIVTTIAGCSLSITLLYSILTYEHSQIKYKSDSKYAKDILTFNISTEWHKSPLVDYVIEVYFFSETNKACLLERSGKKVHELIEHENNKEARKSLVGIFNYMESISLGVKQGLIDEAFVKGFFGSVFAKYYFEYHFYIEYRRSIRNNVRIWNNYTTLAERWVKEQTS